MAYTEMYARTGGSDLNSGSSNANSASLTYASGTWVQSTRVFTVASGNPLTDGILVGDFVSVYADGSSATAYVARVTARDATTITTSATIKVGTAPTDGTSNRTLKRGGAWATLATAFTFATGTLINVAGDLPRLNIVGGPWSITSALTHPLSCPA